MFLTTGMFGALRLEGFYDGDGTSWSIDFRIGTAYGTASVFTDSGTCQIYVEDIGPAGVPS
jgi:hypothetical protein